MHRKISALLSISIAAWTAQPSAHHSLEEAFPTELVGQAIRLSAGTTALGQRQLPLMPRDSGVAILVTTAECGQGRMGIAAFRQLEHRLRASGIAFRVVVKSAPAPSRQYARLFLHPEAVIGDPEGEALGPLDTRVVPSLVVLNRAGVVVSLHAPLSTRAEDAPAIAGEASASALSRDVFEDHQAVGIHLD